MPEVVGRLRTPRLASAPSSPAVGEVYYDTALSILYWWNGTAWISAAGTTQLDYNGGFPTGTPYTDGDIVVYNGISYLCVKPTSAAPKPWPIATAGLSLEGSYALRPVATAVPVGTIYYASDTQGVFRSNGTAWVLVSQGAPLVWYSNLDVAPWSTPYDGMEVSLVHPNNMTVWRLKYYAGDASTYKWQYTGGAPITAEVSPTQHSTASAGYVFLTSGPSVTIPRAGDYEIAFGFYANTGSGGGAGTPIQSGVFAASDDNAAYVYANDVISVSRTVVRTCGASGATLDLMFRALSGVSVSFGYRWLRVTPMRIS